MFGRRNKELFEIMQDYVDKPDDFMKNLKKRIRELRPLAAKVQAVIEMPGWTEVIGPFLENQSNPGRAFRIYRRTENEVEKAHMMGMAEAFYNLSLLIRNLLSILNIPEETEEEEEEIGTQEDIIERERKK